MVGYFDTRELADALDIRASTLRQLIECESPLIPKPLHSIGYRIHFWPEAAIRCWVKQGYPAGWTYDEDEFGEVANEQLWEHHVAAGKAE